MCVSEKRQAHLDYALKGFFTVVTSLLPRRSLLIRSLLACNSRRARNGADPRENERDVFTDRRGETLVLALRSVQLPFLLCSPPGVKLCRTEHYRNVPTHAGSSQTSLPRHLS